MQKTDAGTAKTAYTTAGGLVTDTVYTDVTAAVTGGVTATITAKTATLRAATAILLVNAATDKFAMKAALEANASALGLNMTAYNALSAANKIIVADYLYTNKTYATVAAVVAAFTAGMAIVS